MAQGRHFFFLLPWSNTTKRNISQTKWDELRWSIMFIADLYLNSFRLAGNETFCRNCIRCASVYFGKEVENLAIQWLGGTSFLCDCGGNGQGGHRAEDGTLAAIPRHLSSSGVCAADAERQPRGYAHEHAADARPRSVRPPDHSQPAYKTKINFSSIPQSKVYEDNEACLKFATMPITTYIYEILFFSLYNSHVMRRHILDFAKGLSTFLVWPPGIINTYNEISLKISDFFYIRYTAWAQMWDIR